MARWSRQIVFGDVDAMFASSAIVANPALVGKLVAVGSPPPRGIITSASYPARRFGVKAAMPTAHALRLCPDLVLVHSDHPLYRRMHERMREVTDRLFPITEWTSIDEFYTDTTELQSLHRDPVALGRAVKDAIFEATGLCCTVAIATGKRIAKVAADAHKPDGLVAVEPGTEAAFLAPQPVRSLPGIGPKTAAQLERLGNEADDWARVRVTDGFDPRRLRRCRLHGDVALGHFCGGRAVLALSVPRQLDLGGSRATERKACIQTRSCLFAGFTSRSFPASSAR